MHILLTLSSVLLCDIKQFYKNIMAVKNFKNVNNV